MITRSIKMTSFTGLLGALKKNSSDDLSNSILFTSCQAELVELMKQIDIMVDAKRSEWESQVLSLENQLTHLTTELNNTKSISDRRKFELDTMKQQLKVASADHKVKITAYENQLNVLSEEVKTMKSEHKRFKKKTNKQSEVLETSSIDLSITLKQRNDEIRNLRSQLMQIEKKLELSDTHAHECTYSLQKTEQKCQLLAEKCMLLEGQLLKCQNKLNVSNDNLQTMQIDYARQKALLKHDLINAKEELIREKSISKNLEELLSEEKGNKQRIETKLERKMDECEKLAESEKCIIQRLKVIENENDTIRKMLQGQTESYDQINKDFSKQLISSHQQKCGQKTGNSFYETESVNEKEISQNSITNVEGNKNVSNNRFSNSIERNNPQKQSYSTGKKVVEGNNASQESSFTTKRKMERIKELYEQKIELLQSQLRATEQNLKSKNEAIEELSESSNVSERMLKELSLDLDHKTSELHVANAQTEALRLENKHLNQSLVNEKLNTTNEMRLFETHLQELQNSTMKKVTELENKNEHLQQELVTVRNELTELEIDEIEKTRDSLNFSRTLQLQIPAKEDSSKHPELVDKISQLDDILQQSRDRFKEQLLSEHQSQTHEEPQKNYLVVERPSAAENGYDENLNKDDHERPIGRSSSVSDAESTKSVSGSTIARRFLDDELEKQQELHHLLDVRIAELQRNTDESIARYITQNGDINS